MEDKINIIFFTDPICSTCWGIEPHINKFKLEYGHLVDIEYRKIQLSYCEQSK